MYRMIKSFSINIVSKVMAFLKNRLDFCIPDVVYVFFDRTISIRIAKCRWNFYNCSSIESIKRVCNRKCRYYPHITLHSSCLSLPLSHQYSVVIGFDLVHLGRHLHWSLSWKSQYKTFEFQFISKRFDMFNFTWFINKNVKKWESKIHVWCLLASLLSMSTLSCQWHN